MDVKSERSIITIRMLLPLNFEFHLHNIVGVTILYYKDNYVTFSC